MRRLVCLAIAAALAAGTGRRAPAEEEWERPFPGTLPDPEEDVSVNPAPFDMEGARTRVAAFLLDGATGRPMPGATLTLYPERPGTHVTSFAETVGRGTADARGVAIVETEGWDGGSAHWVADAPGYAPTYEWGARPPSRMLLRRGTDVRGRVLDPAGRPVADAEIDVFPGCSHSGQVRAARTGKDGTFVLASVFPDGDLHGCARSRAGLCRFEEGFGTLGRRPVDLALRTSIRVRGRYVDDEKRPVAGVVVRGTDFRRWPVAVSDADGRWELPSFAPGDSPIHVAPGDDVDHDYCTDRVRAGDVPKVIRIDGDTGEPERLDDDAAVEIRAALEDGGPAPEFSVLLVRLDDGYETETTIEAPEDVDPSAPAAPAVLDSEPSGDYEIRPYSAFEPATFAPVRVRLAALARTEVALRVRKAPVLRVEGDLPVPARVTLVVPGGEEEWDEDDPLAAWRPHLPADGDAWLRIEPEDHRLAFFAPVGPEKDGVRAARVAVPEPHRIQIRAPAEIDEATLRCDGFEVAWGRDGGAAWTYAEGPMTLDVTCDEETRRFEIDLGAKPVIVDLDWDSGVTAPPAGRVVVRTEDVHGTSVRVEGRSWSISGAGAVAEGTPPCRVIVARRGHQTFDRTFTEPAELLHRWGRSTLRLTVTDAAGAPVHAIVAVDGVLHWTRRGELDLAGLAAGPHDVIVDPVDDAVAGAELRLVLGEGAVRERTVVLPAAR